MASEVVVITPELAPGSGGLADYTRRVVEQWPDAVSLRFLVARGLGAEELGRSAEKLRQQLPGNDGKVLLQYSAYGFDHFGYPRTLLRALSEWRRRSGGRLVVMLHEIWTFWPVLNRNYLIQQLHRRALRDLLSQADTAFTSTGSQAEHLRRLCPRAQIEVLPVGSNIRMTADVTGARDMSSLIVFGLQPSRLKALQQTEPELRALSAAGRFRTIVTAGAGNTAPGDQAERELLNRLALPGPAEKRGAAAEEEISRLLIASGFGLSVQDELSATKSGTLMAYAAHGLNILSPFADPSRPAPLCWATHPSELLRGVSANDLQTRATNLRAWSQATCSWPRIAEQFARALQLGEAAAVTTP